MAARDSQRAAFRALFPDAVYPLAEFKVVTGLGERTIRYARDLHGVELPTFRIGRAKFFAGDAAITYMKKLAAIEGPITPK